MLDTPAAFWHTVPLHYLPPLLATGALWSKAALAAQGSPIRPRPSAVRRDRKLGLAGFVHLSFAPATPLLADKRRRGFPHALLEFAPAVADLPGAAFLRYNTKAWRHRDDFVPITGGEEKAAFLSAWRAGKFPSAELLVAQALPLEGHALGLHLATPPEAAWAKSVIDALQLAAPPVFSSPDLFPPGLPADLTGFEAYADACAAAGVVLPPPDLAFD